MLVENERRREGNEARVMGGVGKLKRRMPIKPNNASVARWCLPARFAQSRTPTLPNVVAPRRLVRK